MTRDEHLTFCKRCTNRKFDFNSGVVCSLTGEMAAFDQECADYKVDDTVEIMLDDQHQLSQAEVKRKLSGAVYESLRLEQNLPGAIVAGVAAAFVCAVVWSLITLYFELQAGIMAILLGGGVGFAMRKAGHGVNQVFGFFGAGISFFGCVLGKVLSIIGFVAMQNNLNYFETLFMIDYSQLPLAMGESFGFADLIFIHLLS